MITTRENNRFQLEELIHGTWQTKEDIENLLWKLGDDPEAPTEDEVQNTLIGIIELHNIRCKRLFSCFEEMLKNGAIT
jgi:hypothetical protein